MDILLTNRSLSFRAGSELWTLTMFRELGKDHNVDVFTCGANRMIQASYDKDKEYDLAIINHNVCLNAIKDFKIKKRIFTSHGVIPNLERPVPGADVYVGVSEETRDGTVARGFECDTVIRNPINTETYKEIKPVNRELKNILYISNRYESLAVIQEACKDYNLEIIGAGNNKSNVEEYINNADLVITLGRGVYESLSCNRNVIVFDRGKGDGFVNHETIKEFRQNNCSGRNKKIIFTPETLKEEFKKYDPNLKMRNYILENNNVKVIANKYLNL